MINDFFNWCVLVLEIMAEHTGMSYELINILIFVILQPLLILIFFYLWRKERYYCKSSKNIKYAAELGIEIGENLKKQSKGSYKK